MSVPNATPTPVSTRETTPAISRTNIILIVLLLVQLAVSAYLLWPSQGATASGDPLLAGVTADSVNGLTITDNNDRAVSFVKEGEAWTLAGTEGYPVRSDKITQTLDKLIAMTTDRMVTQTAGSHDRLQVAEDNFQRKVEITTASGVQTVYLGSSAGASATHVRLADQEATYLTSGVAAWELDTLATTWIDVAYYHVPKEQIRELTLQNGNGTFTFVRNGEEWTLADAAADENVASANINTLVDRVASLNLNTVLGKSDAPEYGLATPLATLIVTTTSSLTDTAAALTTTTLLVGAKNEDGNAYYFKSSDSEFYVLLATFTGDEFVNKTRTDFMVQATETSTDATVAPSVDASTVPTATNEVNAETVLTPTEDVTDTATISTSATVTESEAITGTGGLDQATPPADEVESSGTVTETTDGPAEDTPAATPEATPSN